MQPILAQIWRIALITICGLAGSTAAGLMRYGGDILILNSLPFLFVAYGVTGSLVFAVYHQRGAANALTTATVVSAVQFGVSVGWVPVWNAAIWSFGVNVTVVLLAFLFERKLVYLKHGKTIVVGLMLGVVFVLLTLMIGLFSGIVQTSASTFRNNFIDGALVGLGLGFGVDLGESIVHSLELEWSGKGASWPTHRGGTNS
jgi:hypothetical protein